MTKKIGPIAKLVPTPTSLPDPGDTTLKQEKKKEKYVWPDVDKNAEIRTGKDTCYGMSTRQPGSHCNLTLDTIAGPNKDYAVPTMEEMGYSNSTTSIRGGTDEAHACLDRFLADPPAVASFSKPNTAPTSLEPSTTLLSPYLKFGCVSVREVWWGCKETIAKWEKEGGKGKKTTEPENMFGQLEFRDMYAAAEAGTKHFERIRGNHTCK